MNMGYNDCYYSGDLPVSLIEAKMLDTSFLGSVMCQKLCKKMEAEIQDLEAVVH